MKDLEIDVMTVEGEQSSKGEVDIFYEGVYGPTLVAEINEEKALKLVKHLCKVFSLGRVVVASDEEEK